MARYLNKQITKDLQKKMVFLGGPRQVGKTTIAKSLLTDTTRYLNWDIAEQRETILHRKLPASKGLLVLDELHKYRFWRGYLKGLYDDKVVSKHYQILVTGSARLDYYRRGGDSLQGRYHYLRMHPLSIAELVGNQTTLEDLFHYGGFPEPFFGQDQIEAKRWSLEYRERLLRDDLSSLEKIHDVGNVEHLMLRLPDLVGSPLSINALREDLQLNHKTVANWLDILERLYAIFRIAPFGGPKIKAVKKEQKHYHFDWTLIKNDGLRFENMIACHLLKWVHWNYDTQGREMELRYFRDVYKREVDFIICEDSKPIHFIECKLSDDAVNNGLLYLRSKYPKVTAWQISLRGTKDYLSKNDIRVCPAIKFLVELI